MKISMDFMRNVIKELVLSQIKIIIMEEIVFSESVLFVGQTDTDGYRTHNTLCKNYTKLEIC
jgi:hypothetical protein